MLANRSILIAEDEFPQREALCKFLCKRGYDVHGVENAEAALDSLRKRSFALLITDLRLPGIDGLELAQRAHEIDDELSVLLVTAYASVESVIEALRTGVSDYLLKPLILHEVARKVDSLLQKQELLRENARLQRALSKHEHDPELVAHSPAMQKAMQWIPRAAASRANVLITGETGTGKEVVARVIHRTGDFADKPFTALNLAAIPETIIESELFGHERGAFTGAVRRRDGVLRATTGGTVLLDEIGELPVVLQAKLLRAIEAREVRAVGSDRATPFDARIICATHRDLKAMVTQGTFREDLLYRLNVLHIELPPLRDRRDDVPALVRTLIERHASKSAIPTPTITAEAIRALCEHPWRGNIRELSNVLERALILADDGCIDVDLLPDDVREVAAPSLGLREAVESFERDHIAKVLRLAEGNRDRAAELLGVSAATVYRRLERLDLRGFEVQRGSAQPPATDSHR